MIEIYYTDFQFFLFIGIFMWMFFIYLGFEKKLSAIFWIQFILVMPISFMLLTNDYLNGLSYGSMFAGFILFIGSYLSWIPVIKDKLFNK